MRHKDWQAREAYRSFPEADEPGEIAALRTRAAADGDLAALLDRRVRFDEAVVESLWDVPVPAGCRQRCLEGLRSQQVAASVPDGRIPRRAWWAGSAVALAAAVALLAWNPWGQPADLGPETVAAQARDLWRRASNAEPAEPVVGTDLLPTRFVPFVERSDRVRLADRTVPSFTVRRGRVHVVVCVLPAGSFDTSWDGFETDTGGAFVRILREGGGWTVAVADRARTLDSFSAGRLLTASRCVPDPARTPPDDLPTT